MKNYNNNTVVDFTNNYSFIIKGESSYKTESDLTLIEENQDEKNYDNNSVRKLYNIPQSNYDVHLDHKKIKLKNKNSGNFKLGKSFTNIIKSDLDNKLCNNFTNDSNSPRKILGKSSKDIIILDLNNNVNNNLTEYHNC